MYPQLPHLITGECDHFQPYLIDAINKSTKIEIAVSFIKLSGLNFIKPALADALDSGVSIKILTGDYLQITDPQSLNMLMLLKEKGSEVRIFESKGNQSFHPKVYIFLKEENGVVHDGQAFIGSSNISHSALFEGIEWNIRIRYEEDPDRFREITGKFEKLFDHEKTKDLTYEWIEAYKKRYAPVVVENPVDVPKIYTPNEVQNEALAKLEETRKEGFKRGLVVLATGLGKTWLSAFDAQRMGSEKILFVAHRDEILDQALETFVKIRPDSTIGKYTGKEKAPDSDILFASIQTLGKVGHLRQFAPDYFDYIIVDEFHHAAAGTYQKLLKYFKPGFLLGLTATPERTDQADIFEFCDGNRVFEKDLLQGIKAKLLCPFVYYGIHDRHVDYEAIKWRSNKFDIEDLVNHLATNKRADHILTEWKEKGQDKTLAFCASKNHAEFMAEYFNTHGVISAAVHSSSETRRNEALQGLRNGAFKVVFSVDLFNEGVDVPSIDTVMMLRPTESKILFLQQLGRGLRTDEGKDKLHVLDFIGNHKSFLKKPEALFGISATIRAYKEFLDKYEAGTLDLPPGCFVNYDLEVIDYMKHLATTRTEAVVDLYDYLKNTRDDGRPTAAEMFQVGAPFQKIRQAHGSWFEFVNDQGDLNPKELACLEGHKAFFTEMETTRLTKSFKMVTLEALMENDGFTSPLSTEEIARMSLDVIQRRKNLRPDIAFKFPSIDELRGERFEEWHQYWKKNPINAFVGGNSAAGKSYFKLESSSRSSFDSVQDVGKGNKQKLVNNLNIKPEEQETFETMLQEIVNYKFLSYSPSTEKPEEIVCKVTHSSTPIIKLNDTYREFLPDGDTPVKIEGKVFSVKFVKLFVNVIHDAENTNVISDILKKWFGPEAGATGTAHKVKFYQDDEGWVLAPLKTIAPAIPSNVIELPYYPNLKIACGHFKEGYSHDAETKVLQDIHGKLDPKQHLIVQATGNSMDGGKNPVKDGDYLLLERIDPNHAGSISNQILAIEQPGAASDNQYLLRNVKKNGMNDYTLVASNPEYEDMKATEDMRTFGRLKEVLDPFEVNLHRSFTSEQIPELFGYQFNPGLWNNGHICPKDSMDQILRVTLNKAGKEKEHRYLDFFSTPTEFHWQSQGKTTQTDSKGLKLRDHVKMGSKVHLFVRKKKLLNGKGAPFWYCGEIKFLSWNGNGPVNVTWRMKWELSEELQGEFLDMSS